MTDELSHMDEAGNVRMVDVGDKAPTARRAVAEAMVQMSRATRERLFADDLPKGDAIATVRIAAIQGAKQTSSLIPLCHPLPIESVAVNIEPTPDGAVITVTATVTAKTPMSLLVIPHDRFGQILADTPGLSLAIARELAQRLQNIDKRLY